MRLRDQIESLKEGEKNADIKFVDPKGWMSRMEQKTKNTRGVNRVKRREKT
jgi:hypothetical protein